MKKVFTLFAILMTMAVTSASAQFTLKLTGFDSKYNNYKVYYVVYTTAIEDLDEAAKGGFTYMLLSDAYWSLAKATSWQSYYEWYRGYMPSESIENGKVTVTLQCDKSHEEISLAIGLYKDDVVPGGEYIVSKTLHASSDNDFTIDVSNMEVLMSGKFPTDTNNEVILNETNESYPSSAVWDETKTYDITLNRTFKANQWNSLMLPFPMTAAEIKANFGSGVQILKLLAVLWGSYVVFTSATTIEPGCAYLVKPTSGISQIYVTDKTGLKSSQYGNPSYVLTNGAAYAMQYLYNNVWFAEGVFYKTKANDLYGDVYVLSNGKYYYVNSDVTMNGYRWALCDTSGSGAKELDIMFDDDPTAIESIEEGNYGSLSSPAEGKYIENGKLVIVKNGRKYNAAGQLLK